MGEQGIYYAVGIVYIGICYGALRLWYRKYKDNHEVFFRGLFLVFMPVLGLLFFFLLDHRKNTNADRIDEEYKDIGINNGDLRYLHEINKEEEVNKVAMEEALSMNNYKMRRKILMDILQKDDSLAYLDVLKKALVNEDTETSHYATAVIMEMKKKLGNDISKVQKLSKIGENHMENFKKWEEVLSKAIFSEIYDERNLTKYYKEYKKVSDYILKEDFVEEKYYLNRIRLDFKLKEYEHAKKLCMLYKDKYPQSEQMVICMIKYYVLIRDRENLDLFLQELKDLPVYLTQETLQYVRFLSA